MTIWEARRARDLDPRKDTWGPRILCGRRWGVNYCAAPPIAYVYEVFRLRNDPPAVVLPAGLIQDPEIPGLWEWSAHAQGRLDLEQDPGGWRHRHRFDAPGPSSPSVRTAPVPVIVPCRRGHHNRIDIRLTDKLESHRSTT
jgi:hypothetical protein